VAGANCPLYVKIPLEPPGASMEGAA